MVRAAITGAFDYAGSDPTNKQWKLRHRLIISGLMDQDDKDLLRAIHQHWLGYVAHGNLTEDSFEKVKNFATDTLKDIKTATYPWAATDEPKEQNATITSADQGLIERYKAMHAQFKNETTGK